MENNDEATLMIYHQNGVDYPMNKLGMADEAPVALEILEKYTGEYEYPQNTDYVFTIALVDNSLLTSPPGSHSEALYALSETEFYIENVNAVIKFNRNDTGETESISIFLAGGYSILKKKEPTSVVSDTAVPEEVKLRQNIPNPFNPTTEIYYDLSSEGHVRLTVYNLSGQTIAVLVDEVQSPGKHGVTWNASGFPSGMYFYRLISGRFSETKRMLLLK